MLKFFNRLKLTLVGPCKNWENIWFEKLRVTFAWCFLRNVNIIDSIHRYIQELVLHKKERVWSVSSPLCQDMPSSKLGLFLIMFQAEKSETEKIYKMCKCVLKNRWVTFASWSAVHYFMLPLWTAYIDIFRSLSCIRKSGPDPSPPLCARICLFHGEF